MPAPSAFPLSRSLGLLACLSLPSQAAEWRVTTFLDEFDGACTAQHCSLREAIAAANATPESPAVVRLGVGTYVLSLANASNAQGLPREEDANRVGDLDLLGQVSLIGAGPAQTLINGARLDRLIDVQPGANLSLRSLTLTGGSTLYDGGGVRNRGTLHLLDVTLSDNRAYAHINGVPSRGGALANFTTAQLHRVRAQNNLVDGGDMTMGQGGALFNAGTLLMRDSRIEFNRCVDYHEVGMGCGLFNQGTADLARVALIGNRSMPDGMGGAILNLGTLTLTNATLSDNYSGDKGAALDNGNRYNPQPSGTPSATLSHVTIADNDGYGLLNHDGTVSVRNAIIAGNRQRETDEPRNCHQQDSAIALNVRGLLLGSDAGNCVGSLSVDNHQVLTRQLFALAENNGTVAHALRRTSAALDSAEGACPQYDQRGLTRPRDGDGDGIARCDLGAFERAGP
ncbi:CSLREA domain-containing protein [Pseudomonas sp. PDM14]|uniref:CSLREA domain-containing protein n=1 Tax=Pseudomonas sp. PDM14 TaxID=2769288 RepID=UPI00177B47CD|nr:CSLREA domain-containing protein [Pseudomonas sp. PDM14]MBD9482780.1 CSLREA domain-containing protein [Pseudomonas sp. PDM14]